MYAVEIYSKFILYYPIIFSSMKKSNTLNQNIKYYNVCRSDHISLAYIVVNSWTTESDNIFYYFDLKVYLFLNLISLIILVAQVWHGFFSWSIYSSAVIHIHRHSAFTFVRHNMWKTRWRSRIPFRCNMVTWGLIPKPAWLLSLILPS